MANHKHYATLYLPRKKNLWYVVAIALLGQMISGCATIWPVGIQRVPVELPDSAKVFDLRGNELPIVNADGERSLFLTYSQDDTLRVLYRDTSYRVMPSRVIRLGILLDYLYTVGIGGFVDDVSNNSFRYHSLKFDAVTPRPWYTNFFGIAEANAFSAYSHGQAVPLSTSLGIGAGYHLSNDQKIEVYGMWEELPDVYPTNSEKGYGFEGDLDVRSIKVRLYPYKGCYLTGGLGWDAASARGAPTYVIDSQGNTTTVQIPFSSSKFRQIEYGIGYSGDWTFIEYERAFSTPKNILFGSQRVNYSMAIFRLGINVRFP